MSVPHRKSNLIGRMGKVICPKKNWPIRTFRKLIMKRLKKLTNDKLVKLTNESALLMVKNLLLPTGSKVDRAVSGVVHFVQIFYTFSIGDVKYRYFFMNTIPIFSKTYRGCPINLESESAVWHSDIWRTYMVHICVKSFKMSWKSMEWALDIEQCTRYGTYCLSVVADPLTI